MHRRLGNQHHASQFNRRTIGVTRSLKANTQVNVKVIATSTDDSEQPVRSGCQGTLDGSHILTGCGACKIAATILFRQARRIVAQVTQADCSSTFFASPIEQHAARSSLISLLDQAQNFNALMPVLRIPTTVNFGGCQNYEKHR